MSKRPAASTEGVAEVKRPRTRAQAAAEAAATTVAPQRAPSVAATLRTMATAPEPPRRVLARHTYGKRGDRARAWHKLVTEKRQPLYVSGIRLPSPPSPTPPPVARPPSAVPTVLSSVNAPPSPKSTASIIIPRAASLFSQLSALPSDEAGLDNSGPFEARLASVEAALENRAPAENRDSAEDRASAEHAESEEDSEEDTVKSEDTEDSQEASQDDSVKSEDATDEGSTDGEPSGSCYSPPPSPPPPIVFKGKAKVIDLRSGRRDDGQHPTFLTNTEDTAEAIDGGLNMQAPEADPEEETGAGPGPSTMAARAQRAPHETQRVASDAALARHLQDAFDGGLDGGGSLDFGDTSNVQDTYPEYPNQAPNELETIHMDPNSQDDRPNEPHTPQRLPQHQSSAGLPTAANDTPLNELLTPYDVPKPPHTQTARRSRWSKRHWHQHWRELTFFEGVKALGGSVLQNPATGLWVVEADVSPDKRKGLEKRLEVLRSQFSNRRATLRMTDDNHLCEQCRRRIYEPKNGKPPFVFASGCVGAKKGKCGECALRATDCSNRGERTDKALSKVFAAGVHAERQRLADRVRDLLASVEAKEAQSATGEQAGERAVLERISSALDTEAPLPPFSSPTTRRRRARNARRLNTASSDSAEETDRGHEQTPASDESESPGEADSPLPIVRKR